MRALKNSTPLPMPDANPYDTAMDMLPLLVIILVSLWAIVVTVMAIRSGRALRTEREAREDGQDKLERYRTALAKLEASASETVRQFNELQTRHQDLQRAHDAVTDTETAVAELSGDRPAPSLVSVEQVDLSAEIGTLFEHVARVATAIRNYSAFTRGHNGQEHPKARYDLLWLADCLHSFDEIGRALTKRNPAALAGACAELTSMYETYLKDGSGYDSRDTFQRLAAAVPLGEAKEAIRAIMDKAARLLEDSGMAVSPALASDRLQLSAAATARTPRRAVG